MEIEFLSDVQQLAPEQRRIAYLELCKRSKRSDTLSNRITAGVGLSKSEIDAFVDLFGKGCQAKNKGKLRARLESGLTYSVGIYNRVVFDVADCKFPVEYVAGQSYPKEVRCVRETIIKKG